MPCGGLCLGGRDLAGLLGRSKRRRLRRLTDICEALEALEKRGHIGLPGAMSQLFPAALTPAELAAEIEWLARRQGYGRGRINRRQGSLDRRGRWPDSEDVFASITQHPLIRATVMVGRAWPRPQTR